MTTLDSIVKEEFERRFGWPPDDLDIHVADYLAKAVCGRLGVAVPDLTFPAAYAEFAAALGRSSETTPTHDTGLPEVCSGGGPVLAIPRTLVTRWRGTDNDDYERACTPSEAYRPTEYGGLDWVTVGEGQALVLDLELMTTIVRLGNEGVIVRNWSETPTEADIVGWVAAIDHWETFPGELVLDDGVLMLFDAAAPGAADPSAIESEDGVALLELGPGSYRVQVAVHDGLDVLRLSPAS